MQWLARICVQRPTFASVLMLLIVVIGFAGYTKLGVDQFPNVDLPFVIVTTKLPGGAPEEVETDVSDKIEAAVNTISGIDELRSTSSEGVSLVVVAFDLDKDADVAAQEVRDKVSQVMGELPRGIDPPVVTRVDPDSAAVLLIALRSDKPVREVTEVADKVVRRQIESISGVGQVTVIGGQARKINVWLDPLKLKANGLLAVDVQRALASQNLSSPGGSVDNGPARVTVRVEGRVRTPEAIGRIVVREGDGHPIRVEDVARVEDGQAEENTYASLDGERTVVLSVRKQSGKNTVAVVDSVVSRLDKVRALLPPGMKLEVVRDNSAVIRTGISAVKEHLVVGAILAALVVLLFLGNVRSTVIAALSIPVSIIGTFGVMWAAGYTLNFLTLLALALAVGIVIDDAIVVLENIVRYVDEKGMKPFPAAILATREIGLPVLATTLSLLAVFIPVGFMGGIVGRFLASFGLTMAFSIAVSLLVSFTLTPSLAARWLKPGSLHGEAPGLLTRVVDSFYKPIERTYMKALSWAMGRRWVIVVACLCTVGSCVPLAKQVPGGFLPPDDQAQFEVNVRAPEGTSLTATRLTAERMAEQMRTFAGVDHTLLTVGEGDKQEANASKIYVLLSDPKERAATQFDLMERVRNEIFKKDCATLRCTAGEVAAFSTGSSSANIQVALKGRDLSELARYATTTTNELRKTPGAVDVDNNLILGKPEIRISVDRDKAASLGVRISDIADTLRLFVGGLKATAFAEGGEEFDVDVRAEARFRADPEALELVTVPSSKFGAVPLSSVVTMKPGSGPSEINRLGRERQITIMANAAPGYGDSTIQAKIEKSFADQHMATGYVAQPVGRSKEQGKAAKGFLIVIGLAFVFMYLILAAQFESWLHPITILLSLPLTVPFALLSLILFHQTLNIFSGLGLLVLFGVVKKNAILQIDHTNQLRKGGMDRLPAILQANKDRLRPILMTTLAFVAGMIPLVMSRGVGAGKNQTTGAIVLGGQTLSLLLTLLAVPVAYSLFDDLSAWFQRKTASKEVIDRGEAELRALLGEEEPAHGPHPAE